MSQSTDVAVPSEDIIGLEDVDQNDLVMPRLKIIHAEGVFADNLSGEKFDSFSGVLLGVVKQRVLWAPEVDDDAEPLCKSYDFTAGHAVPTAFPWKSSGFDRAAVDATDPVLPCDACPLKDWGSHPKGDNPWCTEQHTYIVLVDGVSPALVTFQKSGIKSSRAYLSSFKRAMKPLFTALTRITLTPHKRGTTAYAIPSFVRTGDTDPADWEEYATLLRSSRTFLQTPRKRDDDADSHAAVPSAAPAASSSNAAKATASDDDFPDF